MSLAQPLRRTFFITGALDFGLAGMEIAVHSGSRAKPGAGYNLSQNSGASRLAGSSQSSGHVHGCKDWQAGGLEAGLYLILGRACAYRGGSGAAPGLRPSSDQGGMPWISTRLEGACMVGVWLLYGGGLATVLDLSWIGMEV